MVVIDVLSDRDSITCRRQGRLSGDFVLDLAYVLISKYYEAFMRFEGDWDVVERKFDCSRFADIYVFCFAKKCWHKKGVIVLIGISGVGASLLIGFWSDRDVFEADCEVNCLLVGILDGDFDVGHLVESYCLLEHDFLLGDPS